jgi:predicted phosphoribosyltransferase
MKQYLNERYKKMREITELKEVTVVWVTDGAASGRVIEESSVGVV